MIDMYRLKEALAKYKETFVSKQWPDEKYKWEAVKCFQDNWDVNAPDFADMLTRSFAKTYNLLASMNNFPAKMIQDLQKRHQKKFVPCTLHCSTKARMWFLVFWTLKTNPLSCLKSTEMALGNTTSMRMLSGHICGYAT